MIRVLLVEDDPVIRDTTRYFLNSQQNYEVVCAETGGEALSHARENFDVILMDILLPDTNGMDLCQRLRSWHHCPIIFTSCLDDTDTVVRALELGGDDFLAKPYNHKVLLARIMANIRRVQMDAAVLFYAPCFTMQFVCTLPKAPGLPGGRLSGTVLSSQITKHEKTETL